MQTLMYTLLMKTSCHEEPSRIARANKLCVTCKRCRAHACSYHLKPFCHHICLSCIFTKAVGPLQQTKNRKQKRAPPCHACTQVADSTCGLAGSSFSAKQARALQQPSTAADICRPLVDSVKAWENIAAAEYGFDGVMEGWEGDSKQAAENSEDKFLQVMHCCSFCGAILLELLCMQGGAQHDALPFGPFMVLYFQTWLRCLQKGI